MALPNSAIGLRRASPMCVMGQGEPAVPQTLRRLENLITRSMYLARSCRRAQAA